MMMLEHVLPLDILECVLAFCDIDTRRSLGAALRRLGASSTLEWRPHPIHHGFFVVDMWMVICRFPHGFYRLVYRANGFFEVDWRSTHHPEHIYNVYELDHATQTYSTVYILYVP